MTTNQTWTDTVHYPIPGLIVYKGIIPKELNVINRIESVLGNSVNYKWQEALVGYGEKIPEYRDCFDFKFKKTDIQHDSGLDSLKLQEIWQNCYDRFYPAVQDYCAKHNLAEMKYWESFNFVKYNEGQHFQYHADHGFSYNCTVSMVQYLNDDYEGGELHFDVWGYLYKPEAGDLVIFPSNYMYPHRAMPVTNGTKYSIVTMLDYSDKYHKPEFYAETGS